MKTKRCRLGKSIQIQSLAIKGCRIRGSLTARGWGWAMGVFVGAGPVEENLVRQEGEGKKKTQTG